LKKNLKKKTVDVETTPGNIRTLRYELGLSQPDMAELLSVHHTTISRWENGGTKPREDLEYRLQVIMKSVVDRSIFGQ